MSEWRHFVAICKKVQPTETLVLVLTFVLTVVFDLVVAIAVGLSLHIIFILINKFFKKA
jgi:SulP family sulfate permease